MRCSFGQGLKGYFFILLLFSARRTCSGPSTLRSILEAQPVPLEIILRLQVAPQKTSVKLWNKHRTTSAALFFVSSRSGQQKLQALQRFDPTCVISTLQILLLQPHDLISTLVAPLQLKRPPPIQINHNFSGTSEILTFCPSYIVSFQGLSCCTSTVWFARRLWSHS